MGNKANVINTIPPTSDYPFGSKIPTQSEGTTTVLNGILDELV